MESNNKEMVEKTKGGKPVVYMCFKGEERSVAMQRLHKDLGEKVGVFKGGTKRMYGLSPHQVQGELDGKFVYLIYSHGSSAAETVCASAAEDKLDGLGIPYEVVSTMALQAYANNRDKVFDDYLV